VIYASEMDEDSGEKGKGKIGLFEVGAVKPFYSPLERRKREKHDALGKRRGKKRTCW